MHGAMVTSNPGRLSFASGRTTRVLSTKRCVLGGNAILHWQTAFPARFGASEFVVIKRIPANLTRFMLHFGNVVGGSVGRR